MIEKEGKGKEFNGILTVDSIESAIKYNKEMQRINKEKGSPLKIATIFSFQDNEEEIGNLHNKTTAKEELNKIIKEYNKTFGTNFNIYDNNGFNRYRSDISDKVKKQEINILIVVNMFLTGFDSKFIKYLFVDKNLEGAGLIQAFSRTNRVYGKKKPYGVIISFRDLKVNIDKAFEIYGNEKSADKAIVKESEEELIKKLEDLVSTFIERYKDIKTIDVIKSEKEQKHFVNTFNNIERIHNKLNEAYTGYSDKEKLTEQSYKFFQEDIYSYRSRYKELYEKYSQNKDNSDNNKVDISNDIEFNLEILNIDKIDNDYIFKLIKKEINTVDNTQTDEEIIKEYKMKLDKIIKDFKNDRNYSKNKKDLIEEFIKEYLMNLGIEDIKKFLSNNNGILEEFDNYKFKIKNKWLKKIADKYKLDTNILENYLKEIEIGTKSITDTNKVCSNFEELFQDVDENLWIDMIKKGPKCQELYQDVKDLIELFTFSG